MGVVREHCARAGDRRPPNDGIPRLDGARAWLAGSLLRPVAAAANARDSPARLAQGPRCGCDAGTNCAGDGRAAGRSRWRALGGGRPAMSLARGTASWPAYWVALVVA